MLLLSEGPALAADTGTGASSDPRALVGLLLVGVLVSLAGIDFVISLIRKRRLS